MGMMALGCLTATIFIGTSNDNVAASGTKKQLYNTKS